VLNVFRRRPGLRRLALACAISLSGDQLLLVFVPYLIFQRTHSAAAASSMFFVIAVPRLVVGFFGGYLADFGDRKRVMVLCHLWSAGSVLGLFAATHVAGLLWAVYPVMLLEASASQIFLVSRQTAVPRLVPSTELTEANSLMYVATTVPALAGPAAGGFLLAAAGFDALIALDLLTFAAAIGLILSIREPLSTGPQRTVAGGIAGVLQLQREGIAEVWRPTGLRQITLAAAVLTASVGAFLAVAVPFASGVLRFDAREIGILFGVFPFANLALAALVPRIARPFSITTLYAFGLLFKGTMLVLMVTVRVPVAEFAIFACFAIPDVVLLIVTLSAIQAQVQPELLGRVSSTVYTVLYAAQAVGTGSASLAVLAISPAGVLGACGVLLLVVGLAFAAVTRQRRAAFV